MPANESLRLTVMKRLCQHLSDTIVAGDDYTYTIGENVHRGRIKFTEDDAVPAISVLENIDPDRYPRRAGQDEGAPLQKDDFILLLHGWCEDDKVNPSDNVYELLADVKKALALLVLDDHPQLVPRKHENFMLGGLITGMTMEPGTVRPPQEQVSSNCTFWLRVTLKVVEDPNDPYLLQP